MGPLWFISLICSSCVTYARCNLTTDPSSVYLNISSVPNFNKSKPLSPFTLKSLFLSLQAVRLVSLHPLLQSVSHCGFSLSSAFLRLPALRQHSLHAPQHWAKCIWWTLLSKVPHNIMSAYKFSCKGLLGVKALTLAGLVTRSVKYLEGFKCGFALCIKQLITGVIFSLL